MIPPLADRVLRSCLDRMTAPGRVAPLNLTGEPHERTREGAAGRGRDPAVHRRGMGRLLVGKDLRGARPRDERGHRPRRRRERRGGRARARRRRRRAGGVGEHAPAGAQRHPAPSVRHRARARRRHRPADGARDGQAPRRGQGRGDLRQRVQPLVQRGGRAHLGPLRLEPRGHRTHHRVAAPGGPGVLHHAVELPPRDGHAQDRSRPGRGLHGRDQAG